MQSRWSRFLIVMVVIAALAGVSRAVIPIREYDVNAAVTKVTPADDAQQKKGILATIEVKGWAKPIVVTKETNLHRQEGKLVPEAKVGDLKKDQNVTVWLKAKSDNAEAVLIFR